jgi:hypothetical protein
MDELVVWLRAQLDEDERAARAAGAVAWQWEHGYGGMCNDRTCPYGELATDRHVLMEVHGFDVVQDDRQVATHIARHHPARILVEVEAKRQLLRIHRRYAPEDDQACLGCAGGIMWVRCPVVRLLALPYADRPGYREEWRP